jgi:phosphoadenosine phosphosulfate reductase
MKDLAEYQRQLQDKNAQEIVSWAVDTFGCQKIILATSFSVEDQVLTDMILAANAKARIFTLDTGRLFQETYETWQKTVDFWKSKIEVYFPDPVEISDLMKDYGPNLFYRSVEERKLCCAVRKTHSLQKVLKSVDSWICGLRREQAVTRFSTEPIEWDESHQIYKINPLYNWSEKQVWDYIKSRSIPYNPLQEQGFRSIGCQSCTRAIGPEDDIRDGRWWWEEPEHKECGLHNRPKIHP